MRFPLFAVFTLITAVAACHHAGPATVTPAASPAASNAPAIPTGVTVAAIARGDTIFNTRSCVRCHGANGVGSARAPSLTDQTWIHIDGSYDAIVRLVTTGFTKAEQKDAQYQFSMNPRGGMQLTDDEIAAVAAYIWSLSHPTRH